jgi:hypothetical protein
MRFGRPGRVGCFSGTTNPRIELIVEGHQGLWERGHASEKIHGAAPESQR